MKNFKTKDPGQGILRRKLRSNDTPRESLLSEDTYTGIRFLSIHNLVPFNAQSRMFFDEEAIDNLAVTIKKHGIRQPLTVISSPTDIGKMEIVSGERRFRAAQKLKLEKVPCIIISDYKKATEIALIENVQREDLHPIEAGRGYETLIQSQTVKTQQELADAIGVPRSKIVECIKFAKIPNNVAKIIVENKITKRNILRYISSADSEKTMLDIVHRLIDNNGKNDFDKTTEIPSYNYGYNKTKLLDISLHKGSLMVNALGLANAPVSLRERIKSSLQGLIDKIDKGVI